MLILSQYPVQIYYLIYIYKLMNYGNKLVITVGHTSTQT